MASLIKGMWVLPLAGRHVLWVHDELYAFFKATKGCKAKASEVKKLRSAALRSAPAYHHQRRLYLTSTLAQWRAALDDEPSLVLGAKKAQFHRLLDLCRDELAWLIRHQVHAPANKGGQYGVGGGQGGRSMAEMQDVLVLLHYVESSRRQAEASRGVSVHYSRTLVYEQDAPALAEMICEEVNRASQNGRKSIKELLSLLAVGVHQ